MIPGFGYRPSQFPKIAELLDEFEAFVTCPECDKEIIIDKPEMVVKCPNCGTEFRPHLIELRKKRTESPSFRGFRLPKKEKEKEKIEIDL